MFYLFLELQNKIVFILTLHPAQINVALDLRVIFLTLSNPCCLLGNSKCQFVRLQLVFSNLLIKTTAFLSHTTIGLGLFFSHLLDAPLAMIYPELCLFKRSQNVRCHSVDMQLGLTSQTNYSVVLLFIFWVKLWKGKSLEYAVNAAEGRTKVALNDLFALKF